MKQKSYVILLMTIIMLGIFTNGFSVENIHNQKKVFAFDYTLEELENGLKVLIVPTGFPNIVAVQVQVQAGSRNEVEPGKTGFAHFFEHMMFRGTDNYSAEEYNRLMQLAGVDNNAYTNDDFTNYYTNFSKEDLETIIKLEADRFMNLKYPEEAFKTEAGAILGEYNKDAADPGSKLYEILRNTAFQKHTYKHTTMGFFEDIKNMPNLYEYSLEFYNRYYRPEKTTLLICGDVNPKSTLELVKKYWGSWQKGADFKPIPVEPAPNGPLFTHLKWDTSTLPLITVAFHSPAFVDTSIETAALSLIAQTMNSPSSPLYQKLVMDEKKVDWIYVNYANVSDPQLFNVTTRVKNFADFIYVRDEIIKALADFRINQLSFSTLNDLKNQMRYSMAQRMDNSIGVAFSVNNYLSFDRDPETLNRFYNTIDQATLKDIQLIANKYFVDKGMVQASIAYEEVSKDELKPLSVDKITADAVNNLPELKTLLVKNQSPLLSFRILFNVGAIHDPVDKSGLANLTAAMIVNGSSTKLKFNEIEQQMFSISSTFRQQIDKEMTVFSGTVHKDNLDLFYELITQQLLTPAWSEDDFKRIKADLINQIEVNLKQNNDEELAKEVLYEKIYHDHLYGHYNKGHVSGLESITLDDLKQFYQQNYIRANLVFGLAGDYDQLFVDKIQRDFGKLPLGDKKMLKRKTVEPLKGFKASLIQKETMGTAISFGFPIEINRSHPDFPALMLFQSFLGQHRNMASYLFQHIRSLRGMNYGDYAYIEYFPDGGEHMRPIPNLARQEQIFQVWIRPVETDNAHFAIRIAMFELERLITNGLTQEDFERTRNFLSKYVNIMTNSQNFQLGYALDSQYYGIDEFTQMMREQLQKLTLDDVNRIIKKYLNLDNIQFVVVTSKALELKDKLINNTPSPITYSAEKPAFILEEDKIIQELPLNFKPENIEVLQLNEIFK